MAAALLQQLHQHQQPNQCSNSTLRHAAAAASKP